MGDSYSQNISGNAFVLVDPNELQYQFATRNYYDNPLHNFSVPNEDLSIEVELRTTQKGRTVLIIGVLSVTAAGVFVALRGVLVTRIGHIFA